MKLVIQRVKKAKCIINNKEHSSIKNGFLIYLGISHNDREEDIKKYVNKVLNLRVFSDDEGKMNLNIKKVNGEILIISQFTLYANTKKGNRPSFIDAANPNYANQLYEQMINEFKKEIRTESGIFGENMQIESINDGPVTIILEDI